MYQTNRLIQTVLLGTCLFILISLNVMAQSVENIQVETLAQTSSSWDGNTLPDYPEGRPEITILKITIPPKAKLPEHKHPYINAGVLLKGELTVVTEEQDTLYLKSGDSIVELVNTWHYGRNEGNVPAEIVVFYAGVSDKPVTIRK